MGKRMEMGEKTKQRRRFGGKNVIELNRSVGEGQFSALCVIRRIVKQAQHFIESQ